MSKSYVNVEWEKFVLWLSKFENNAVCLEDFEKFWDKRFLDYFVENAVLCGYLEKLVDGIWKITNKCRMLNKHERQTWICEHCD